MSAEDQKDDVTADAAPVSPGALLRAARLASGRPLADILTETRFTQRNIEALESDNYDSLPGASYARGYMRRYAETLGLDPNDMVARMNVILGSTYHLGKPVQASVLPEAVSGPKQFLLVFVALFAAIARTPVLAILSILLIGALVFGSLFWRGEDAAQAETPANVDINAELNDGLNNLPPAALAADGQQPPASAVPAGTDPAALPADPTAPATPGAPGAAPTVTPGAAPLAAPGATAAATPGMPAAAPGQTPAATPATGAPAALATPAAPAAASLPNAFPSAPPLSPLPQGTAPRTETLTFKFVGQSWISVRDATGQELVYGLKNAGQTVNVTGQAPFSINIGKVAFTTLTRNGTPVNLTPYQRGEIASFRLNP